MSKDNGKLIVGVAIIGGALLLPKLLNSSSDAILSDGGGGAPPASNAELYGLGLDPNLTSALQSFFADPTKSTPASSSSGLGLSPSQTSMMSKKEATSLDFATADFESLNRYFEKDVIVSTPSARGAIFNINPKIAGNLTPSQSQSILDAIIRGDSNIRYGESLSKGGVEVFDIGVGGTVGSSKKASSSSAGGSGTPIVQSSSNPFSGLNFNTGFNPTNPNSFSQILPSNRSPASSGSSSAVKKSVSVAASASSTQPTKNVVVSASPSIVRKLNPAYASSL